MRLSRTTGAVSDRLLVRRLLVRDDIWGVKKARQCGGTVNKQKAKRERGHPLSAALD